MSVMLHSSERSLYVQLWFLSDVDILLILKWIELATWGTQDEEKQKQKHNTTQHKYVSDTTVLKQT